MKKRTCRLWAWTLTIALLAAFPVPAAFAADACDGCKTGTFASLAACVTADGTLHVCEKNFPDARFRTAIAGKADRDGDGAVSKQEAQALTALDCAAEGISDLKGVGYFADLTELNCAGNQLKRLDLSANPALTQLDCSDNAIAMLDLSKNTALKKLSAEGQTVERPLDTAKNRVDLYPLIERDESEQIIAVGAADAKGNFMDASEAGGTITFSAANPLYAEYTVATGLSGNALGTVKVRVYPYTDGEFAGMPARVVNGLLLISEKNFPDPAFRRFIRSLAAGSGHTLTAEALAINELRCADKGIADLTGIAFFKNLETLDCSGNILSVLDLSGCKLLKTLDCAGNRLTALDLSANTALTGAYTKLSDQAPDALRCIKTQDAYTLNLSAYVGEKNGSRIVSFDAVTADGANAEPAYSAETCTFRFRLPPAKLSFRFFTGSPDQKMPFLTVTAPVTLAEQTCESGVFNGSDAYLLGGNLHICEKNFPDAAFRAAVTEFDADGDGCLSAAETAKAETLKLNSKGVASLQGIAYLTALQTLSAADNALTELDLSKNTALTSVNCSANRLSRLDLSANEKLEAAKVTAGSQTGRKLTASPKGSQFSVSLTEAVGTEKIANITAVTDKNGAAAYDPKTGEALFDKTPESPLTYQYNTGLKSGTVTMSVVCELSAASAEHSHTALTFVPAKASTCTENGHAAYYTCTCGKYFADEKAAIEIAELRYIEFPLLNHRSAAEYSASALYHWYPCVNEGCEAIMEGTKALHTDADRDGKCDVCGSDKMTKDVPGDVDGDGQLTPADARLALRISIGLEADAKKNTVKYVTADADLNDSVTPGDARLILRAAVELEALKNPLK